MTERGRIFDYFLLAVGLLMVWLALFAYAGPEAISPPAATLTRVVQYLGDPQFWTNARATGLAFLYAAAIAVFGGLALGFLLGASRLARDVGESTLSTLYAIPKITLYPVILLLFGLGISAKVAFGALHGIFPVALFTIGAIKNTPRALLKTSRVMRLSPLQTAWTILLPAALPEIVTGIRIGLATTLFGTIVGELFASEAGLGFMLIRAMAAHQVREIMALTVILFVVAGIVNAGLVLVTRRIGGR